MNMTHYYTNFSNTFISYNPGQHLQYFQHDFTYGFHTVYADKETLVFVTDLDI